MVVFGLIAVAPKLPIACSFVFLQSINIVSQLLSLLLFEFDAFNSFSCFNLINRSCHCFGVKYPFCNSVNGIFDNTPPVPINSFTILIFKSGNKFKLLCDDCDDFSSLDDCCCFLSIRLHLNSDSFIVNG